MKKDAALNDVLKDFPSFLFKNGWVTVYQKFDKSDSFDHGAIFSSILKNSFIKSSLSTYNWDISFGSGGPTILSGYENGKKFEKYSSIPDKNVEPFILVRDNFGHKESYIEVQEEFRLYYNLYQESHGDTTKLIYIDENGDETDIVVIEGNKTARVRQYAINDYISTRNVYFAIYFDLMRHNEKTLLELGVKEENRNVMGKNYIYNVLIKDSTQALGDDRSLSWIMGKSLIPPTKNYKIDYFNRLNQDSNKFCEFIVGFNQDGSNELFTCDDRYLANYFGANEGSPQYVTPIYFKKEVLKKYYDNSERYSVHDGWIQAHGSWILRLDNNCDDYVIAFLGDLGKLHYKEQLYWKSFNIEKQKGLSATGFSRAYLGQPANPSSPDLYFKLVFEEYNSSHFKKNGWKVFKPLNPDDNHYYESLHLLTTENNRKEFDEQILGLTKVLIDSINEKEISRFIQKEENDKGIDKLEKYLKTRNLMVPDLIRFFRNLQDLRSTTVAHRKSASNAKAKIVEEYFKIDKLPLRDCLEQIFLDCIKVINTLNHDY